MTISHRVADGNGAAIFTESGATARKFEKAVEAGQIGTNCDIHSSIVNPFNIYSSKPMCRYQRAYSCAPANVFLVW